MTTCSSGDVYLDDDGNRRLKSCGNRATHVDVREGMVHLPKCARHAKEDDTHSVHLIGPDERKVLEWQDGQNTKAHTRGEG